MRFSKFLIAAALALGIGAAAPARSSPSSAVETTSSVPVPVEAPSSSMSPTHALERADVDAWLDGLMPNALRSGDIAGGVVVVVKNGQILTARGFGYSDVEARRRFDPAATLIGVGSISKTFTWSAVMQLVEQGRIDLDADINQYLDFKIPPRDGRPITMRQLMTHTSGFEEKLKNLLSSEPLPPLDVYLKDWTPKRIYPSGEVPAYSNYGTALAGYVVARVSGQPFEEYMDRHVLRVLGMQRSSFRRPVPENLRPMMTQSYAVGSGEPKGYEYAPIPAGALWSTGEDMAQFMIAHLDGGAVQGGRLFSAATASQMHTIQPKIYPQLNGMALGLYEHSRNGRRILAHNGDTQYLHSDMHLFLDDRVGIFVSLNSSGKDGAASTLNNAVFREFTDRYFPYEFKPPVRGVSQDTAVAHARLVSGYWLDTRRSASSFMSVIWGLLSPLKLTANDDGSLSVPIGGRNIRAIEIAPFVWQDDKGQDKIQVVMRDGQPQLLGFSLAPPVGFQPYPGWRSPAWLLPALAVALFSLLVAGLAWPIGAAARKRFGVAQPLSGRRLMANRLSRGLSLAAVVMFIGIIGFYAAIATAFNQFVPAMDPVFLTLKLVTLITLVSAFAAVGYSGLLSWSSSRWFARIRFLFVFASAGLLLWTVLIFGITNLSGHY